MSMLFKKMQRFLSAIAIIRFLDENIYIWYIEKRLAKTNHMFYIIFRKGSAI